MDAHFAIADGLFWAKADDAAVAEDSRNDQSVAETKPIADR